MDEWQVNCWVLAPKKMRLGVKRLCAKSFFFFFFFFASKLVSGTMPYLERWAFDPGYRLLSVQDGQQCTMTQSYSAKRSPAQSRASK
jgi:hypothetical protein